MFNRPEIPNVIPQHEMLSTLPRTPSETQLQTAALTGLLSGDATFATLKYAIEQLTPLAPKDSDVVIQAFNIIATKVVFCQPHTLLLHGVNEEGHDTFVVAHFSQLVAHVIYRPKIGPQRIVTGFQSNVA
jgi:hypothetical protein